MSVSTPCEHGPQCKSWPRCSAEAYNEWARKHEAAVGKRDAEIDSFIVSLLREMKRTADVVQSVAAQQRAVRNTLLVCGWSADGVSALDDEPSPLDAVILTNSLAVAATNKDRTQPQRDRLRLACIEAGALAMLLGEKRPGLE